MKKKTINYGQRRETGGNLIYRCLGYALSDVNRNVRRIQVIYVLMHDAAR